jgi:protein TonB
MLLQGFNSDPSEGHFYERRRGIATFVSLAAYGALLGWAFTREPAAEQDTLVEVEIKDLAVPEPPKEEEPQPEPEPPPPPPPEPEPKRAPEPKVSPPVQETPPPPQPVVPDSMPDKPPSEADSAGTQRNAGDFDRGVAGGRGQSKAPSAAPAEPVKPKVAKKETPIDPKVPVEKPEKASNPKPLAGNAPPKYPEVLRTKGITGNVYVKILVYYDGSVRGAKILRKDNNASNPEDQELASKLFVTSLGKVMPTWKYEPAKLNGQAISVWFSVNVPFKLTQE